MQDLLNDPAYFNAFFDSLQTSKERDHQLEAALTRNTAATGQSQPSPAVLSAASLVFPSLMSCPVLSQNKICSSGLSWKA